MFNRIVPFIFAVLLQCSHLAAQQLNFRKLGSDDGLTVNTINRVVQDKQGFIWIATMDGLNRFDGYTVRQYYSGGDTQSVIPHNDLVNLFCDEEGYLWISATDGGITRYHPQTGNKTLFRKDTSGNGLLHTWVTDFAQGWVHTVWVGTRKGLCCFDSRSGTLKRVDTAELDKHIQDVLVVDSQTLWLSTRDGLLVFDVPSGRVSRKLYAGKSVVKAERWREDFFLVMLQNERLILLDKRGRELPIKEPLQQQPLITLLVDQSKQVWIGSQKGLLNYDVLTGQYKAYLHNAYDNRSVSTNVVTSLFEDRTGNIWAGSSNAGLNYFDPHGIGFNILQSPLQLQTFNNVVLGICEDALGNVWMANGGGLTYWNRNTNTIENIGFDANRKDALPLYTSTRSVCVATDGSLWVATGGKGVWRRRKNARNFEQYGYDPQRPTQSLSNMFVYSIQQLRNGELWASTSYGVSRFNEAINQFENFSKDALLKPIAQTSVWKVSDDSKGNTWFATAGNGAYCWNRTQHTLTHYEVNKSNPDQGIVFNQVWCVAEDKQGNHWLGTTNGLSKIDVQTQQITNYTNRNGLPNHNIYGILCDAKGNLWMSSNKGIIKYDVANAEFKNYQINDGVQSNEFNQEAFYASPHTGEFFFGGVKGINYFNPLSIKEVNAAPGVFIGDVLVFEDRNIKQVPFGLDATLKLSYVQDFVSIQFASGDYYHNTQTRYRYKLTGIDESWIDGGNNHLATYSNLAPGSYQFEVIASNNGLDWSKQPAMLSIYIAPPFWETWWFRLLLAIVIPACIGLFIRRRFEAVRNKARLAEEMVDLKMQALRAQMNPHFIFNALNSIQHLIVKGEGDLAFSYLSKFSRLLRLILDVSDRTFISLDKEIEMLKLYLDLEALRFDYHMRYSIVVDEDDIAGLSIPTLLLQPYVENAIWHGLVPKQGERTLHITISVTEQQLLIAIEDNGIGRKRAAEMKSMQAIKYQSKGMNINRDRLSMLGGRQTGAIDIEDLTNEWGEGTGTRVRIILPLAALTNRTNE